MANITITSTTNSINVDFGDYAPINGAYKCVYQKAAVIAQAIEVDHIDISVPSVKQQWLVVDPSYAGGDPYMKIDTVDGVAPTDLGDLYDLLSALVA